MNKFEASEIADALHCIHPRLALEIAKACEQAYRRGYQQGSLYGTKLPENSIAEWRFSNPYELAVSPPDNRGEKHGFSCTSFYRLEMEVANTLEAVLVALVNKTTNPDKEYDDSGFGYLDPKLINKYKKY